MACNPIATDEEIEAIRQMMLKGYVMPKVTYYGNGGYMAPGESIRDGVKELSVASLIARIESDRATIADLRDAKKIAAWQRQQIETLRAEVRRLEEKYESR